MGRKGIIRRLFRNRKDRQLFEDIVVNDDVTAPAGCNQVVRRVLREFDLDIVLESLKRNQGVSMYDLTACMVTHAMQMRGLSINRMEDILEEPEMQEVYGLDLELCIFTRVRSHTREDA